MADTLGYKTSHTPEQSADPGNLSMVSVERDQSDIPGLAVVRNIKAALTTSGDTRKVFSTVDRIRPIRVYMMTKNIDTNAAATTSLKLDVTDGVTTIAYLPTALTANAGAEQFRELQASPLGNLLFNGKGVVWDWIVTATATAATAGTAGELTVVVQWPNDQIGKTLTAVAPT